MVFESTSVWVKQLSGILGVVILVRSAAISNVMDQYPLIIFVLSLALSLLCLRLMFSMSGFRRRAGKLAPVIPGKFSYEKSRQVMRSRVAKEGPSASRWTSGYLGTDMWRWAFTALRSPSSPNANLVYPLSRFQKAVWLFRGGIADVAVFLLILSPVMLLIGHVCGWYAGFPVRLDFMPFFFRVVLITLILMPFGYMGRLYLMEAVWRKAEHSMFAFGAAVVVFVIFVSLLTTISSGLFHSGGMEVMVLGLVLITSRFFFWRALVKYFRYADLT